MVERPLAVITHGFATSPRRIWIPQVTNQLEEAGYQVLTPKMPNAKIPNLDEWIARLVEVIGDSVDATVIAHSCSGRAALHYAETHPLRHLVCVATLVSTVTDNSEIEEIWRPYYSRYLDTQTIQDNCHNILGLYSEDDSVFPYSEADVFEQRLGSVLRFQDQGHFREKTLPINLYEYLKH